MTNINTSRIYRSSILGLAVITAALLAPAPPSKPVTLTRSRVRCQIKSELIHLTSRIW